MWFLIAILAIIASILGMIVNRDFRFYCYSFFLPWLYDHPQISTLLGIRYVNDTEWKTNRDDSFPYIPGLIAMAIKLMINMSFVLKPDVRKRFEYLQSQKGRYISMKPYFESLCGKTITLEDFEDFLSRNIITETNRVFEIIPNDKCEWLVIHSKALRTIMSSITVSAWDGIKTAILNAHHVIRMSLILRSAPESTRILLIAPQLALITNFSKLIVNKRGSMGHLEPYDFLEPVSRFFVARTVENGYKELVFVNRLFDKTNTVNNRAFGPYGLQCPGSVYSFGFIRDVTKFLKALRITVKGEPIVKGLRFRNIVNKKDIFLTFEKGPDWDAAIKEQPQEIPSTA